MCTRSSVKELRDVTSGLGILTAACRAPEIDFILDQRGRSRAYGWSVEAAIDLFHSDVFLHWCKLKKPSRAMKRPSNQLAAM